MRCRSCPNALLVARVLCAALCSGCASQEQLRPFSTDGCSLFPDRSLIGSADWCQCCITHDLAYWRGGTSEARLIADQELGACVLKVTGNKALADLMYAGVSAGGAPHLYTSYRWGYGWPAGRTYRELTAAEAAMAQSLELEYRAANPTLACTE